MFSFVTGLGLLQFPSTEAVDSFVAMADESESVGSSQSTSAYISNVSFEHSCFVLRLRENSQHYIKISDFFQVRTDRARIKLEAQQLENRIRLLIVSGMFWLHIADCLQMLRTMPALTVILFRL